GLGVHEVVVAVLVEELHFLLVEGGPVDAVLRPEAVLGLGAGLQVAELRLNHAAPVAWRDVGDVHDAPERVLVLDGHARAELRGGNQGHWGSSGGTCGEPDSLAPGTAGIQPGLGAIITSSTRRSGPGFCTPCSSPAGAQTRSPGPTGRSSAPTRMRPAPDRT